MFCFQVSTHTPMAEVGIFVAEVLLRIIAKRRGQDSRFEDEMNEFTRWWFQTFLHDFHPYLGKMIQVD